MLFRNIFAAYLIFLLSGLNAQSHWLHHHKVLHQSLVNPAFIQEKNYEIDLSGFGFYANNGGYKLFDFIQKGSNNQNIFNLQKFSQALSGNYFPNFNFSFQTFDFGYRFNKTSFSIGHYTRLEANANLDKDLIDLFANGNAAFIGKSISITPQIYLNVYQTYYIGMVYNFGNLKIGSKIKWLNGNYNLNLKTDNITLKTGSEYYEIEANTNFKINESGLINFKENKITELELNDSFSLKALTPNNGFAFDLGIDYQLTRALNILVNVRDLGSIKWDENSNIYQSSKSLKLKGVDLEAIIDGESTEAIEDSLNSALKISEIGSSYSQKVSPSISAAVKLSDGLMDYSFAWTNTKTLNKNFQSFSLQASRKLSKSFNLGLSYNLNNNSFDNLGFMAHMSLGSFNFYGNTENIISIFKPRNLYSLSARIGLAFKFNSLKKKQKSI